MNIRMVRRGPPAPPDFVAAARLFQDDKSCKQAAPERGAKTNVLCHSRLAAGGSVPRVDLGLIKMLKEPMRGAKKRTITAR